MTSVSGRYQGRSATTSASTAAIKFFCNYQYFYGCPGNRRGRYQGRSATTSASTAAPAAAAAIEAALQLPVLPRPLSRPVCNCQCFYGRYQGWSATTSASTAAAAFKAALQIPVLLRTRRRPRPLSRRSATTSASTAAPADAAVHGKTSIGHLQSLCSCNVKCEEDTLIYSTGCPSW
jgi:hypothetical protein